MEGKIRILLVEDVETDAELLLNELNRNDIQFVNHTVDSESNYLKALTDFKPDIIISDYSLPQFDGLQALKHREKHAPEIPFILVTGSINEETAVECMKAGADDYVIKQNLKRLVPALKSAICKKEVIYAKRRVEDELKETEAIFKAFMEYSPIFIFFKNEETRPIRLSRNYEQMLNLPIKDILGRTMDELFPSDLAKSMIQDDLNVINNGVPIKVIENFNNGIFETTKFPIVSESGQKYLAGYTIDITRQKKAEEALVKSEAFTRMLIESSPIGILYINQGGIITYENSASKKMMGVPDGSISLVIGKSIFELPNIKHIFTDQLLSKFKSNTSIYGEIVHFKSLLNKEVDAEVFTTPIQDNKGSYDGVILMVRDITETVQTQNQLKDRTQKLNTIVNNLHGVVYQCLNDSDWTISFMNDGILELSGYPAEEFMMNKVRSYISIILPEDQEMVQNEIQKSLDNRTNYTIEYRIITSSGKQKWVWEKGHGVFEKNNLVALEGFISDISERKHGEILIKKLGEAIEQSPVATLITDSQGKIEFANSRFTNFTHYSLNDVIGKSPRIFNPGHCSESEFNHMMDTIHSGNVWKSEFLNRKKNGSEYWEDVIISPLTDGNGNILNFIIVTDDITEKKKMMDDLIKAKSLAEESDRLKTSFLQNISHEIRTPMNSIIGFAEILNNNDLTSDKRKFYTEIIQQSSNQLLAVITDIVIIATLESGQEKIRERDTQVNIILKSLFEQFELKAKQLNIDFSCKSVLSDADTTILADDTKLTQILTNLISNAFKFTKKGFVECGYRVKDNYLEFYVKDSGIGIPEDKHNVIFDRFRQADARIAQEYGGTGLGLSISKAYTELMGGRIWIESQLGQGTTFFFTIPYKKIQTSKSNENAEQEGLDIGMKKTILIAEDEDYNFKLISELLSRFNIQILRANNGIDAVEICKSNKNIDLVIMDIKMPRMNGFEATKLIKEFRPELKVIAQTAYAFDNDKIKAFESGCDDYLSKPFAKHQFIAMIKKYLT